MFILINLNFKVNGTVGIDNELKDFNLYARTFY